MTKRLIITTAAFMAAVFCPAQEKEKIELKFSGRAEAFAFSDTYRGVEVGGGLQYMMPSRPNIDPSTGEDLNKEGSLRFGIASTRLGLGTGYKISPQLSSNAFVEVDFMGTGGTNPINIIRLRHAYMSLNWSAGSSLLIGQTSHLQSVDELAPSTVLFGGGYPLNALSRPVQIRYTYSGIRILKIAFAASMFHGSQGSMQSAAMLPDFSARVIFGDSKLGMVGLCAGLKTLRPQIEGASQKANLYTWNASAFGMIKFARRWSARAYFIGGDDLQSFGMMGAIAPLTSLNDYSGTTTLSFWLDLEANLGKGFSAGIFAGQQSNLGFAKGIDLSKISTSTELAGIHSFYRIAPRLWYGVGNMQFGFEYLFTQSAWGKEFDNHYRPVSMLPTATNHRVILMARYNF